MKIKKHIVYNYEKSFERIDKILDETDTSFEELQNIPSRDRLSFTNGFYVNITSLFVDIRDSSSLSSKHKRPALAKIYRSFISEVVAILNGNWNCIEINIIGDCVSGVFETPRKLDIDRVFSDTARILSLIKTLNCKLKKRKITTIKVGVGISYGRALMIKAGYSGSEINDVIWMGDVVNEASKLADFGDKTYNDKPLMVSSVIYNNLNQDNQRLLSFNSVRNCYHGNIINTNMEEWYNENCSC